MLGVFLLPAFTRLGHESQDLYRSCDGCLCTQTRPRFILSSERVLGGMKSEPMLTPREKSLLAEEFSSEEDGTHQAGQRAQHTTNELLGPRKAWK